MNTPSPSAFSQRHLLGVEHLSREEIVALLDLAEEAVTISRQVEKKRATLRGRTQINLFFEASTRTQSSFELAGKRLGADVMNMAVGSSSIRLSLPSPAHRLLWIALSPIHILPIFIWTIIADVFYGGSEVSWSSSGKPSGSPHGPVTTARMCPSVATASYPSSSS